jgi:hypothetical protein
LRNIFKNNLYNENCIKGIILHSEELYKSHRDSLLKDTYLLEQLNNLKESIVISRKVMKDTGITEECFKCSVYDDSTCCGFNTSYKCDSILLLINRLLGVQINMQTYTKNLCVYLTPTGCSLLARPAICLNFLCDRIRTNIPHSKIVTAQNIIGNEIDNLFKLENYLKKIIRWNP